METVYTLFVHSDNHHDQSFQTVLVFKPLTKSAPLVLTPFMKKVQTAVKPVLVVTWLTHTCLQIPFNSDAT